jgi:hypothetical protein
MGESDVISVSLNGDSTELKLIFNRDTTEFPKPRKNVYSALLLSHEP